MSDDLESFDLTSLVNDNVACITKFANEIDINSCLSVYRVLRDTDCIYFTGVGKNFHVSTIIASTFNSLTIRSICVDPVACVHGDMGLIQDGSVVVMISKSGNTQELDYFCRKLRSRGCGSRIILIHSNKDASLKQYSDYDLFVPFTKEADP